MNSPGILSQPCLQRALRSHRSAQRTWYCCAEPTEEQLAIRQSVA